MANATDTTHTLLRAEGFSCPSCVTKIEEKQVGKLDGVENVTVHFASVALRSTTMNRKKFRRRVLIAAVDKAGYKLKASAF